MVTCAAMQAPPSDEAPGLNKG